MVKYSVGKRTNLDRKACDDRMGGAGIGIEMYAMDGGTKLDRMRRLLAHPPGRCDFCCVSGVSDGFAIFTPGVLNSRASGTAEVDVGRLFMVDGRTRGGVWLGIASGPTQRSPTVGF